MKVGERLAALLLEYGIDLVFGVPGGQTLPLYEGIMVSDGRIDHVLMRDERSAGYAADAYARITGRAGVCDATVGPGATNLLSPLAEAYCSSIPVLAIISDIPRAWEHRRERGNASQAISQVEMFSTISKWRVSLSDPEALDDVVDTALRVAVTGKPGPVVVSIPEDVFRAQLSPAEFPARERSARFPRHRGAPDPEALARAKALLLAARRPALLVGGGALISGAYDEIRELTEHLGCPLVTTITGKGILAETHPLCFGVTGSMGRPLANEIIAEADLVFFIGCKAGQLATFGYELPRPGVPTIHLDIDPEEMGRNFPESVCLVADARLGAAALREALGEEQPRYDWRPEEWKQKLEAWYRAAVEKPQEAGEPLRPQGVMDVINRHAAPDDLLVCDASLASGWAAAYYTLGRAGRHYLAPRGLAGLGWGAPAAVGAALATQGLRRIMHFAGDGGFGYSVQELEVMARLELPIVTLVFNNSALAWIKHAEQNRFDAEGFISTDFRHVDFATVARGFGVRGYAVRTLDELAAALAAEAEPQGPAVIDMTTDQWETPVLRFSSGGGKK